MGALSEDRFDNDKGIVFSFSLSFFLKCLRFDFVCFSCNCAVPVFLLYFRYGGPFAACDTIHIKRSKWGTDGGVVGGQGNT